MIFRAFRALNLCPPLHIAVVGGNYEIAMMLLEHGADANARDRYGRTPLMLACELGCKAITMALLLFDCDIWMAEDTCGWTALHYAVSSGDIANVRLLVSCFYSDLCRRPRSENESRSMLCEFVDKADNNGLTALHLAAHVQREDCTRLLLDLRADASRQTLGEGNVCSSSSAASSSRSLGKGTSGLPVPIWPYEAITSLLRLSRERGISNSSTPCYRCRRSPSFVAAQDYGGAFCTACAVTLCTRIVSSPVTTCPLGREKIPGFRGLYGGAQPNFSYHPVGTPTLQEYY